MKRKGQRAKGQKCEADGRRNVEEVAPQQNFPPLNFAALLLHSPEKDQVPISTDIIASNRHQI